MKDEFEIRAMGFGELAQLYNPRIKPESASNMLRLWIGKSKSLKMALNEGGYKKGSKLLTPRQVEILVDYLGPP